MTARHDHDGARVDDPRRLPPGAPGAPATSVPRSRGRDAGSDPLTGLGDRHRLEELLGTWNVHADGPRPLALLTVGLDRFTQVNDTLGHAVGDELLVLAATRIRAATRSGEEVLRIGGDEFVIVASDAADPQAAEAIAARIVEFLGRPFILRGHQVDVGASVGIAVLGDGTDTVEDLLRHADLALHDAKSAGRGTHRRFRPVLEQAAVARRDLEVGLRRALVRRELSLAYQPQVRLPACEVIGFEALLRWHSEVHGTVGPDRFIPIAEEIGEIHEIGAWVLRQACAEATRWPSPLRVAVNVSPVQFHSGDLIEVVADALRRSGLAAERLEVEITEGVLLDRSDATMRTLHAIRDLGVHVALDDFGTGYSSLSHLSSFPFSTMKIDQSFIRGPQTERSRRLVTSILALGRSLRMDTIAEGVETHDQLDDLTREGCGQVQGYLVARPMPPDEIEGFLLDHETPTTGTTR